MSHLDRSLQVLGYILVKNLQLNMTRLCNIWTPNNVTVFKRKWPGVNFKVGVIC